MNWSFWEYETFFNKIDVAVVGSGLVGLNAALSLKLQQPKLNVLVLERGILPSGASTKNAGFACFGSPSELLDDLGRGSEEKVFALVEKRWKGLRRLRRILGDKAIAYEGFGGFEVFTDNELYGACEENIDLLNKNLRKVTGIPAVYRKADGAIKKFGLKGVGHIIENTAEGQIDTGKMMRALISKVQSKGITILNGFPVKEIRDTGSYAEIEAEDGFVFRCGKVLVATNGFAKQLLPSYPVQPARAQVLITSPLKSLKLKGTFHMDRGYYYFRNVGRRVLLGGGRNLDFEGEETFEAGLTERIQKSLEELLATVILPGEKFEIERRWSGIMGLGGEKSYIAKAASKNVFVAVRMGGMGVAIGSLVGEEAAGLVLNS